MVSVTTASPPNTLKKRKRDSTGIAEKENPRRTASPSWKPSPQDQHFQNVKPRRTSVEQIKLDNKRRRSSDIQIPALTTTSLPNTPFASPHLATSPTFSTASAGHPPPTRCHVCFRAQGLTLRISECPVCEKGMCQVCTRQCIVCEQERCSKCCVEEGEEGDPICMVCLAEMSNESDGGGHAGGTEMLQNGR